MALTMMIDKAHEGNPARLGPVSAARSSSTQGLDRIYANEFEKGKETAEQACPGTDDDPGKDCQN